MSKTNRVLALALLMFATIVPLLAQEAGMAESMDSAASSYYLPSVRAAFGTFTYEYSDLPTPFSRWVQDRFLLASTGSKRVQLLNRNAAAALDPLLKASYGQFLQETSAEALLSGRFFIEGESVRVRFELTELSSGTLIGVGDWFVPLAAVPPYASVAPTSGTADRARELAHLSGSVPGGLKVSVSTDRGTGAAYRAGEYLSAIIGVTKDAYVRVYHVDGAGRIQLIWPNRFGGADGLVRTGAAIRLPPDDDARFSFLMEPPFGTEFIKAIASTTPFLEGQSDFSDLGTSARGTMTRGLAVLGSGSTKTEVAEAMASYYIGP
ncbi:MAG: hypothetical protein CVV51_04765 [Spirochaetae bacterium HGW-Spirochaetae-7]|jgi:hypothetical protein|nr:MAG: hypothetical protein CVV51_04765 [Spirochaetae bacterium HGW-Spirochaetae-7]